MANDFGFGGGYNAPVGGFTGGAAGPAQQQQQPDVMAIINWLKQHMPNMPDVTGMAINAGRGSGNTMQRMMGRTDFAPSAPPMPTPAPLKPVTPPPSGGFTGPRQPQQPKASPLASAIATPAPQPTIPTGPGPAGVAPDSLQQPPPPDALPSTPNNWQPIGGGVQTSQAMAGLPAGLGGQPGMTAPPQGGGDLMSLISRLLHMHGH